MAGFYRTYFKWENSLHVSNKNQDIVISGVYCSLGILDLGGEREFSFLREIGNLIEVLGRCAVIVLKIVWDETLLGNS